MNPILEPHTVALVWQPASGRAGGRPFNQGPGKVMKVSGLDVVGVDMRLPVAPTQRAAPGMSSNYTVAAFPAGPVSLR